MFMSPMKFYESHESIWVQSKVYESDDSLWVQSKVYESNEQYNFQQYLFLLVFQRNRNFDRNRNFFLVRPGTETLKNC